MVTTSILVVESKRANWAPKKLFENLIFAQMVSIYVYWTHKVGLFHIYSARNVPEHYTKKAEEGRF